MILLKKGKYVIPLCTGSEHLAFWRTRQDYGAGPCGGTARVLRCCARWSHVWRTWAWRAPCLSGRWPDGGRMNTVARWTRRRAAPAHVPIPDLTCPTAMISTFFTEWYSVRSNARRSAADRNMAIVFTDINNIETPDIDRLLLVRIPKACRHHLKKGEYQNITWEGRISKTDWHYAYKVSVRWFLV